MAREDLPQRPSKRRNLIKDCHCSGRGSTFDSKSGKVDTKRQAKAIEALGASEFLNLIEFSRAVHAEMEAIISVARTGKAGLMGGTIFSTTFPCHNCARHIVAAGIKRV